MCNCMDSWAVLGPGRSFTSSHWQRWTISDLAQQRSHSPVPILSWSDMVRRTREECLLDVVCEEREEISSSSAGPCGGQTVGDTETALTVQSVLGRQGGHSQAPVTQWHHHNSPVRTWWGSHRSHAPCQWQCPARSSQYTPALREKYVNNVIRKL